MQENQTLRNLIRNLGSYIGDGIGGILPSLGFERAQEFLEFINRAETDTAFEGFQRRKKAAQAAKAQNNSAGLTINLSKKRSMDDDDHTRKRTKSGLDEAERITGNGVSKEQASKDRFAPLMVPLSPATGTSNSYYSPMGRSGQDVGMFSELLQGQNSSSPMYMTGPDNSSQYVGPTSVSSGTSFPPAYHPPISVPSGLGSQPYIASASIPSTSPTSTPANTTTATTSGDQDDQDGIVDDPKLQEATKLIQ